MYLYKIYFFHVFHKNKKKRESVATLPFSNPRWAMDYGICSRHIAVQVKTKKETVKREKEKKKEKKSGGLCQIP